jgi:hypothetical protein
VSRDDASEELPDKADLESGLAMGGAIARRLRWSSMPRPAISRDGGRTKFPCVAVEIVPHEGLHRPHLVNQIGIGIPLPKEPAMHRNLKADQKALHGPGDERLEGLPFPRSGGWGRSP